jgi:hypothetical protein
MSSIFGKKILHPQLNLPYGEYIIIAEQEAAGGIWCPRFDLCTMRLLRKLTDDGLAMIFQARRTRFDVDADPRAFVQVVWLKKPALPPLGKINLTAI